VKKDSVPKSWLSLLSFFKPWKFTLSKISSSHKVTMEIPVLWAVTPCSLVNNYQHFGAVYCIFLHNEREKHVGGSPKTLLSTKLHGVSLQKRIIFIITAMRSLNLIKLHYILKLRTLTSALKSELSHV
jgi:hypothetical protein